MGMGTLCCFGCAVEMMVIGVDFDDFCLFQFVEMKEFIMCWVFQLQYFHIDGPVDLWHLGCDVIDINPCQSVLKNVYIFSSPSVSSDLNLK